MQCPRSAVRAFLLERAVVRMHKHMPGMAGNVDATRNCLLRSERAELELYLAVPPLAAAPDRMTAHIRYTAWIAYHPATLSPLGSNRSFARIGFPASAYRHIDIEALTAATGRARAIAAAAILCYSGARMTYRALVAAADARIVHRLSSARWRTQESLAPRAAPAGATYRQRTACSTSPTCHYRHGLLFAGGRGPELLV